MSNDAVMVMAEEHDPQSGTTGMYWIADRDQQQHAHADADGLEHIACLFEATLVGTGLVQLVERSTEGEAGQAGDGRATGDRTRRIAALGEAPPEWRKRPSTPRENAATSASSSRLLRPPDGPTRALGFRCGLRSSRAISPMPSECLPSGSLDPWPGSTVVCAICPLILCSVRCHCCSGMSLCPRSDFPSSERLQRDVHTNPSQRADSTAEGA